jgi:hypothetical protein
MSKLKNMTVLVLSLSLIFISGQLASLSPAEIPKPGPKPKNIRECVKIPCPPVADIMNCNIIKASGGIVGLARLRLSWAYDLGERPYRLLITVFRKQGHSPSWRNIMPASKSFEARPPTRTAADVTIFGLYPGDYQIVFQAYYSCNRVQEFPFIRRL